MLKSELDNLIKDNFGKKYESTLEEFTRVEAIYMNDVMMTKEEAAKIWKALYFDQAKKRWEEFSKPIESDEILKAFRNNNDRFVKKCFFAQVRAYCIAFRVYNYTYACEPMWEAECNGKHWKILDSYSCQEVKLAKWMN